MCGLVLTRHRLYPLYSALRALLVKGSGAAPPAMAALLVCRAVVGVGAVMATGQSCTFTSRSTHTAPSTKPVLSMLSSSACIRTSRDTPPLCVRTGVG